MHTTNKKKAGRLQTSSLRFEETARIIRDTPCHKRDVRFHTPTINMRQANMSRGHTYGMAADPDMVGQVHHKPGASAPADSPGNVLTVKHERKIAAKRPAENNKRVDQHVSGGWFFLAPDMDRLFRNPRHTLAAWFTPRCFSYFRSLALPRSISKLWTTRRKGQGIFQKASTA